MEVRNKRLWRRIAMCGSVLMLAAFCLSIAQYFYNKQYDRLFIARYASLFINTWLFACFLFLIFNPLDFRVYAAGFYVYALGNTVDNGNLLALAMLIAAFVFARISGFFMRRRALKAVLLAVPLVAALCVQCYRLGWADFLISQMQNAAFLFIAGMLYCLVRPELNEFRSRKKVAYIDESVCSAQELEWLRAVLAGERYVAIAARSGVSESTVKARLIRLYRALGAQNRTEFCAMYRNTTLAAPAEPSGR